MDNREELLREIHTVCRDLRGWFRPMSDTWSGFLEALQMRERLQERLHKLIDRFLELPAAPEENDHE